ncbi:MAG: hypothetical protein AAGA15_12400 [Pseudomonadota bacterium]
MRWHDRLTNTERHYNNPDFSRVPVTGRIAVSFVLFLGSLAVLRINGVSGDLAVVLALSILAAVEALLFAVRRWRARRLQAKATELYKQVGMLERTAKELEIQAARKSGAFARWEKK